MNDEKAAKILKGSFMVFSALLGWSALSLVIETSETFNTFSAGALAIVLFELSVVYWAVAIVLSIDLFGTRKDNPILTGKKLLRTSVFVGFSSTLLMSIIFFGPASPLVPLYAVVASLTPGIIWALFEKKLGNLKIKLN